MSSAIAHATDWAIDLAHVDKKYRGKIHALRGIDMRVHRGEVFGLLGPNGAGKSTLVKILLTVIAPTRAEGTVLGQAIGHKGTLARVGYLPEHHKFPEYLTGRQVLDFYGALSGVERSVRRTRAPELLDLVGMTDWASTKVKQYSKGMRQRIGIAQALMNDPDLVVLDEPTDGVDPVGRRDIRGMVQRLKEHGKTVFLNSHLLSELEMVCDRVAILVQGKVASQGTIAELTDDQARYEIELWLDEGTPAHALLARALPEAANASPPTPDADANANALAPRVAWSGTLSTGELFSITRTGITLNTTDATRVQPIIDRLRASNVVIKSIRPVRPSLEDLFMRAVTDPTTGKPAAPGAAREKA